ncbi:single-stranded DNA-binding protein [Lactococcus petauri]|uniref:single-stranded DNA-binding protein n=1 Tax=Lactococcus petauri TaxID=1940789 RepID=UPI00254C1B47|nr:single-stranded DNA-binding protein [Lactococcus petauri]
MQYNRNEMSNLTGQGFAAGVHIATIVDVKNQQSKNGDPMFKFDIEGSNGETANNWFLFGKPWSDSGLQRILASIEDNNQQIAPIDYGHNEQTLKFLKGKRVFILVKERTGTYIDKNGEEKAATGTEIKNYLCRSEFASMGGGQQSQAAPQVDPFGGSPMEISDDKLPF